MKKIIICMLLWSISIFAAIDYKTVGDIPKGKKVDIAAVAYRDMKTHGEIALVIQIDNSFALLYAAPDEVHRALYNKKKERIDFRNEDEFGKWMSREQMIAYLKNNKFKYHNYIEYIK